MDRQKLEQRSPPACLAGLGSWERAEGVWDWVNGWDGGWARKVVERGRVDPKNRQVSLGCCDAGAGGWGLVAGGGGWNREAGRVGRRKSGQSGV